MTATVILIRAIVVTGFTLIAAFSVAATGHQNGTSGTAGKEAATIGEGFAGPIKIGMTVAQAGRALRPLVLSRTSDGEGIALIGVMNGKKTVMTLYAGEEDPSRPINQRARIKSIEVWDSSYRTSQGVHPDMPLKDVESKYGPLTKIVRSEIESREYAYFAKLPRAIGLRVEADGSTAGIYSNGERKSDRYNPAAHVVSILISEPATTDNATSLCSADERVVFSAFVAGSNKIASVCSSRLLNDHRGYLQYRFGRPDKIELQFPEKRQNSQRAFTYTRYTRPLVTYLTLTFSTTDYRYSIHQDDDAEIKPASRAAYISVEPIQERPGVSEEITIHLRGRVRGTLMTLEDVVSNEPWSK
jgi:hypothetical protein